jgi:hypothetical protein
VRKPKPHIEARIADRFREGPRGQPIAKQVNATEAPLAPGEYIRHCEAALPEEKKR